MAVYRVVAGVCALAVKRGVLVRSPVEGLTKAEVPKQRNKTQVARLDADALETLVAAGSTERWRCALGLAAFAGLRLGELRGLRWADVSFDDGTISVLRSLGRDGKPQPPKTTAGTRVVPLAPALRRELATWKLRSPWNGPENYVICCHDGSPCQERNLRRVLDAAKEKSGIDGAGDRLSWHSLRHSFASLLATDLDLPVTTLAELCGHSDGGFTLRAYSRDSRDQQTVVSDFLERAARAGVAQ